MNQRFLNIISNLHKILAETHDDAKELFLIDFKLFEVDPFI
jgi:hypothetical protein